MQEVVRSKNDHGYDVFKIMTDTGNFEISFEGNLDLYWNYTCDENILETSDKKEIIITKENYFIYELFYKLYEGIKRNRVYYDYENNDYMEVKYNNLYKDNKVKWISDDNCDDIASNVTIEKEEETFKLTFNKSKKDMYSLFQTFAVRFSNSGSRHDPYQTNFMTMYKELKTYDPDCHQIHIEEILYKEKVLKRGK